MTITPHDATSTHDMIGPGVRADLITMVREDYRPGLTDEQGNRGVAQLAALGVKALGVDISAKQLGKARERWPGLDGMDLHKGRSPCLPR